MTALNQSITASDDGDGTSEQLNGLIETNAAIQPGDSGGPLVNTSGDVLGMDTAASAGTSFQYNGQSSGTQGFAIPIDTALSIAKTIEAGSGSSTVHIGETAFLGVEINAESSSSGDSGSGGGGGFGGFFGGNSGSTGSTGNTGSTASGASVASTVTNGPAQEAGLAGGRRHHLARRHDDQFGQRPHERHQPLPPGRQGEHRLDRQLGTDPHRHGPALFRTPTVGLRPATADFAKPVAGQDSSQRCNNLTSAIRVASTAALSTQMRPQPTLTSALKLAGTCEIFCTMRNMS